MKILIEVQDGLPVTTLFNDDGTANIFKKSVKRLLADNQDLKEEFAEHFKTGRRSRPTKKPRPKNYPYIADFRRKTWTYLVKRTVDKQLKSAIFYHPDVNPTVEEILRFNIEFAKTRTKPLNRYEKEKAQKAHERLIRILGEDYESFPFVSEGGDSTFVPIPYSPEPATGHKKPVGNRKEPVPLEELDISFLNSE